MDDERRDFLEKLGAQVDVWKTQVSQLEARAYDAGQKDRRELDKQINDLQIKVREFEGQMDDIKKANEEAWQDLKKKLEKAWKEINSLFSMTIAHFS